MPESVKWRGSSGPTIGATKRWSSVALKGGEDYPAPREVAVTRGGSRIRARLPPRPPPVRRRVRWRDGRAHPTLRHAARARWRERAVAGAAGGRLRARRARRAGVAGRRPAARDGGQPRVRLRGRAAVG